MFGFKNITRIPLRTTPRFQARRLLTTVRMSDYEQKIYNMLEKELQPDDLEVMDVSGGCGSMFAINVTSDKFKGMGMVKQHKMVNTILKDEIAKWHGLQLHTTVKK